MGKLKQARANGMGSRVLDHSFDKEFLSIPYLLDIEPRMLDGTDPHQVPLPQQALTGDAADYVLWRKVIHG